MPKFQLLTGYVHLAGERNNSVYRGPDNPITYPESLILAVIHGGSEHVHTLIEVGEVEREMHEEMDRLTQKYGPVAAKAFPALGGRPSLPERDDNIPNQEQVAASKAAAAEALEAAKSEGKTKPAGKTAKPKAASKAKSEEVTSTDAGVPSLDDLPTE